MKRLILAIALILAASIPAEAKVIGTYTLTLPAASGVVMGDGSGTLSFTLTNTTSSGNETIDEFKLRFDPQVYYVSQATLAPTGWKIKDIKNKTDKAEIKFKAINNGSGLAPGESLVFNIVLTGRNYGPFPADTNNMTDALLNAKVESKKGKKGTYSGTSDTWTRYSLSILVSATPVSNGVGDNFSVLMAVSNRSNVTQTSVGPKALTISGTGSATKTSGPVPSSSTLDPGAEQVFLYVFQAVSSGTVRFNGSAWNGSVNVTSPAATSNDVIIGDFTAQTSLSSSQVTSGQNVTVTLSATNNASQSLAGVQPDITPSGSATMTLVSGPTPAGMGSLASGSTASFTWVYTVTGNVGDTYQFTCSASSNTVSTNAAASPAGEVSAYSVTVVPTTVVSGAANVSLLFTIINNGGSSLEKIKIQTPTGWSFQSASAPAGWQIKTQNNPVRVEFKNKKNPIPPGGSESFTLVFSSAPTVASLTPYDFSIEVKPKDGPDGFIGAVVFVTPYELVFSYSVPASFPTPPVADGSQYYDITVTLTNGGNPVQGVPIQFTSDIGSLGSGSAVTDALGKAVNILTGPLSVTPVSATVAATYLGAQDSAVLPFSSYSGMSLDYVPGTLGPTTVSPGDTGQVFAVSVINTGNSTITPDAVSTFSFSDSTVGGSSVFTTTLGSSSPANIAPGAQAVLTFLAADVDSGFLAGSLFPALVLTDGINSGTRPVTDPVTVSGGSGPILIIRWKESIE